MYRSTATHELTETKHAATAKRMSKRQDSSKNNADCTHNHHRHQTNTHKLLQQTTAMRTVQEVQNIATPKKHQHRRSAPKRNNEGKQDTNSTETAHQKDHEQKATTTRTKQQLELTLSGNKGRSSKRIPEKNQQCRNIHQQHQRLEQDALPAISSTNERAHTHSNSKMRNGNNATHLTTSTTSNRNHEARKGNNGHAKSSTQYNVGTKSREQHRVGAKQKDNNDPNRTATRPENKQRRRNS
jgi:hypothetical protein